MKSNLLVNRIVQIQTEYKDLLKELLPALKKMVSPAALDEINLFWLKNMDLVRLYLANELDKDSYVFTAATFLDFDDKEQYPFLLLGKHHVLDDPLCKYSDICSKMQETHISEKLLEQIVITAEDNIKIIEGCNGHIFVLPLRLLSQTPKDSVLFQMGEQAFISLFNNVNSIKEYFERCDSFADIIKYARDDIGKIVLFSESDDKSLPFEQRYYQAKEENSYMLDDDKKESYSFFVMVFGCIQQAVDVIVSCLECECIPFIRYPVALNYILLLEDNLSDIPSIPEMRYKMCIANLIYRMCDKSKLSQFGFDKFTSVVESFQFNKKVFDSLSQSDVNECTFNVYVAAPVIEKCLTALYSALE